MSAAKLNIAENMKYARNLHYLKPSGFNLAAKRHSGEVFELYSKVKKDCGRLLAA
ncbi:hypothetical protein FACS1894198_1210 [Clostridia bacterium]|nr:hypothetical protein FACS1894198_1210 [Clostridia bacterium]